MAKLAFSKLGLKVNNQVVNILYNDNNIEVKQYLSINDKLKLISDVINNSIDEHSFCNPVRVDVFAALGIIDYYTNITFTEKQKENPVKLFDLLEESGLMKQIQNTIPKEEINALMKGLWDSIDAIYTYQNSAMGILDNITNNYDKTELNADKLIEELNNMDTDLLKNILNKLG